MVLLMKFEYMIELYHPKKFIKYLRNNVFSINVLCGLVQV